MPAKDGVTSSVAKCRPSSVVPWLCTRASPSHCSVPSPDHSALEEADDLQRLLDALALPRVLLVGSSYGGFTALALALKQPERVQALVAVEPPMMRYAEFSAAGRAARAAFRAQTIEPANAAFRAGDDERAGHIMTGGINGPAQSLSPEGMQRRMQNLRAMKMLAAKLYELEIQKRNAEKDALEATKADVGWGSQIRNYVLDQSRIKDLRTGIERSDTQKVLDGDLDEFVEASLKSGLEAGAKRSDAA